MPQSSALLLPPPYDQSLNIFSIALDHPRPATSIEPAPTASSGGGMLHTPYTSSQSVSSSEDSPSPLTPPISVSGSSSSASPRPSPSPNIQPLALAANANESDSSLCAASSERKFSPDPKLDNNAPVRHPEVVLTSMQQPSEQNIPPQPAVNSGKGGCWTCRIRRKKCDEQRTNNACQTCIRLRIDCLGWGPKRPQWMRDKQAVEAYKASIKEKLIKAGMVRGQPRLSQGGASRSSTLPSSSSTPSGPSAHTPFNQPHAASRSMSGPAAFGGLGAMGSIGPMGTFGVMGGSIPGGGMGIEYNQQLYVQQQPQSVRYGPYPSPRTLQGFSSPHVAAQHASCIPQASSVMGAEFDYLRFPDQGENEQQQYHLGRRSSIGVALPHQRNTQQLENRRHSLAYTSSPPLQGSSSSPHGNSPYIPGHSPLSGPFGDSTSSQSTHSSLIDFPNDVFGNMGSMTNMAPSGLTVPGMNSITSGPSVSGSPSMLPGDESLLISGGRYAPPSRPPSTSATAPAPAPSRSSSTPSGGYGDPLSDPSLVDPHVQYYFDSVMPMQYAFASERARGILQNLFTGEPFGALVNASCALAAKHNKTIRVARLLDPPDADPQQSTAQQFFNRACWQLANTATRASDVGAGYTASDALASLHLVAYYLLQGGTGDWPVHLDMACDWLSRTSLCTPENEAPKETLALMGEAEQLAAKMTIWYDVFAAISQHQSPRFLATYRRLFGNSISREPGEQPSQVANMGHFMGCPEGVLLILAETAALSQWKAQERQFGTLSNHELLQRGVAIEERLLVSTIAGATEHMPSTVYDASAGTSSQMHPTRPSGEHDVPSPATSAVQLGQGSTVATVLDATGAAHSVGSAATPPSIPVAVPGAGKPGAADLSAPVPSLLSSMLDTSDTGNAPVGTYSAELYQRVARVFLHSASLYLVSVINEPSPSIPEISNAVSAIISELSNLPSVPIDRMLALPYTLAGCLTDRPEQRHFIRSRLCALDEVIGNVRSVRLLMERVWAIRDTQRGVVDWLDVMRNEFGVELLLV